MIENSSTLKEQGIGFYVIYPKKTRTKYNKKQKMEQITRLLHLNFMLLSLN